MNYYGTRLTDNISRREPEGYLLCLNVPVARIGFQEYWTEELGLPGSNLVKVFRPEDEVFSPETMASFEGMPVTNDHPPEGVDVDNYGDLNKGHAQNIRRGTGEESDLLLADLLIADPDLIHMIMDEGKREISCGYTYELCEENGQYVQRQIRGNHVAVVDAGRAGHRVCIKDHEPKRERSTKMKKSLSKILARMAKDGDIETVAEIIEEMIESEAATPAETVAEAVAEVAPAAVEAAVEEVAEDPAAVVETPEGATIVVDEATLEGVISRLDQIISLLSPAAAADEEGEADPVEEIAEAIEETLEAVEAEAVVEEIPAEAAEEVAAVIEEILEPAAEEEPAGDECGDPDQGVLSTGDAIRAALSTMRPQLAKMSRKQRQKVCADVAARINHQRRKAGKDSSRLAMLAQSKGKDAKDPKELGKRIMASRSANRPKA